MLPDGSLGNQNASSSSAKVAAGTPASDGSTVLPPQNNTTTIDDEAAQVTSVTHVPQDSTTVPAVPSRPPIPPAVNNQQFITTVQPTGDDRRNSIPEFVTPQQTLTRPKPRKTRTKNSHKPVEFDKDTTAIPQVAVNPLALAAPSPVLGTSPTHTPHQIAVSPIVLEPPHLATSSLVLDSSQKIIPDQTINQTVVPPAAPGSPSPTTLYPVLGFSQTQTVDLHQAVASLVDGEPPATTPSMDLDPLGTIDPQYLIIHPDQSIHELTVAPYHPPDLVERSPSDDSGAVVATGCGYELPDVTAATQPHRDSPEGAPDMILVLGESGYEVVTYSSQLDISAPPSTTSSSITLPPEEPIIHSSQQSLGSLQITPDIGTVPRDTAPKRFFYAPRVTPTYNIDRSDLPSWLIERGRLDCVLSVESGALWEKLIATWLRQERRLGFGLDETIVRDGSHHSS